MGWHEKKRKLDVFGSVAGLLLHTAFTSGDKAINTLSHGKKRRFCNFLVSVMNYDFRVTKQVREQEARQNNLTRKQMEKKLVNDWDEQIQMKRMQTTATADRKITDFSSG